MTFYFVGGEDHDFTKIGACSVNTATTAARRTANARCSLAVGPSAAGTDGWQGALSTAVSSVWLTARMYTSGSSFTIGVNVLSFLDGTQRRLGLRFAGGGFFELFKRNAAGTVTTLATSSVTRTVGVIQKLDVSITYGTSGTVNVYLDGSLIISYTGDITTDGATTLSGFVLGNHGSSSGTTAFWSEIVAASEDTRAMSLVTLAPTANGNTFSFDSGNSANIDETTVDDSDLITSATAGQLAQFTISSTGIVGTPAIRAVCVSARAQKGGSGPQNAKLNVRTSGADHLSTSFALPAAMNRHAHVFESNPASTGPWAYTDITAAGFNIGIQSET